jgi:hypothetical protein
VFQSYNLKVISPRTIILPVKVEFSRLISSSASKNLYLENLSLRNYTSDRHSQEEEISKERKLNL